MLFCRFIYLIAYYYFCLLLHGLHTWISNYLNVWTCNDQLRYRPINKQNYVIYLMALSMIIINLNPLICEHFLWRLFLVEDFFLYIYFYSI